VKRFFKEAETRCGFYLYKYNLNGLVLINGAFCIIRFFTETEPCHPEATPKSNDCFAGARNDRLGFFIYAKRSNVKKGRESDYLFAFLLPFYKEAFQFCQPIKSRE